MPTTDEKEQPPKKTKAAVEPKVDGPAQLTLPQLVGQGIMKVLEDAHHMPELVKELTLWYNAQPLEDRQALVKKSLDQLETACKVAPGLYSHFQQISMMDR